MYVLCLKTMFPPPPQLQFQDGKPHPKPPPIASPLMAPTAAPIVTPAPNEMLAVATADRGV
jgi:hypothetical protein